jgi:D-tyrosyl-tRNA(Tyr) deacylase
MRAVVQRVKRSSVSINGEIVGKINQGINVLLGVIASDNADVIDYMVNKIINLRIFEDENGKMNLSLLDIQGECLIISQFTLYGDCRKGRRPSYKAAAEPGYAEEIYKVFLEQLRRKIDHVETGVFQAEMEVEIINDGPVTLLIDSEKIF